MSRPAIVLSSARRPGHAQHRQQQRPAQPQPQRHAHRRHRAVESRGRIAMQLHAAGLQRQRAAAGCRCETAVARRGRCAGASRSPWRRQRPAGNATAAAPLNSTCVSPAPGPCGMRAVSAQHQVDGTAGSLALHRAFECDQFARARLERTQAAASRFHSVSGSSRLSHMPQPSGRKAPRQLAPVPAARPQSRDAVRAALIAIVVASPRASARRNTAPRGTVAPDWRSRAAPAAADRYCSTS